MKIKSKALGEIFSVISEDLELLSVLHDRELNKEMVQLLLDNQFPYTLGLALDSEQEKEACDLLAAGLFEFGQDLSDKTMDLAATEYADIYLNHSFHASPFESVWLDEEQLMMQSQMFEIRDWYKKYGLQVANWRTRSDDHFVCQFQFISHLLSQGDEQSLTDASLFMDEHLFRWFDEFASRVSKRCATSFYAGLAIVSFLYLDKVRNLLSAVLQQPRPSKEEVEARHTTNKPAEEVSTQYVPGASVSW